VKRNNADEASLSIMDVATGAKQPYEIDGAKYASPAWTPDSKGFYYVWIPPVGGDVTVDSRPGYAEVRYHELGTSPTDDRPIFPSTGSAKTFLDVDVSRDGHWMFINVQHGWNQTDVWFRDLRRMYKADATPAPAELGTAERIAWHAERRGFQRLIVGVDALTYVTAWKDKFYALTNDGAPRYRVFKIDPAKPARASWKEIVPESKATIDGLQLAGGHLLLQTLVNASSRLEVRTLDGKLVRPVELPGLGSITATAGEPEDDEAYFSFTSFTQPTETWKTSIKTGKSTVWAKVEIPVDTSRFEVQQVFYTSKDGTRVSMFIVQKKGLVKDGSHPTLLYGYGGFNQNMTPAFASSVAVWLELGGVYAMPNLRGGGEYGEAWHRDGMLDKKQNVFDDFIAAGEYLVREGYTTPDRLAIRGGSNGGLLVGAAMTQRPDLFKAVICAVPLLDMVRYHLFGSGRTWIPEYGSAEDEAQFKTLFAYSPYHHVVDGTRYPALLMMGADSDDRVDPMHARKLIAKVQAAIAKVPDARPALFRLEKNAGHGGGDMVKSAVEQFADQFAFLAWQLGVTLPEAKAAP
jgi:prolyl oligopeptidase